MSKYFGPKSVTGLDFSKGNINFCKKNYKGEGKCHFIKGSALDVPFKSESFDVILNLESSHCYGDLRLFFQEAYRVLRPGGKFYYADAFIKTSDVKNAENLARSAGFKMKKKKDITQLVAKGLEKNASYVEQTLLSHCRTDKAKLMAWQLVYGINYYKHNIYKNSENFYYSWSFEKTT